jgi:hypothetical protein
LLRPPHDQWTTLIVVVLVRRGQQLGGTPSPSFPPYDIMDHTYRIMAL